MIKRVHILGDPGSGKTWLARHLAELLSAPICDLDDLFWDHEIGRYGTRATPETRDRQLKQILEQPRWIVEGVYHQWVQDSFRHADMIIVLKPSVFLRDWHILRRFFRRKLGFEKSKREGLRDLAELVRWNHGYDGDNLRRAMEVLDSYGNKMIVCKSTDAALEQVRTRSQPYSERKME